MGFPLATVFVRKFVTNIHILLNVSIFQSLPRVYIIFSTAAKYADETLNLRFNPFKEEGNAQLELGHNCKWPNIIWHKFNI